MDVKLGIVMAAAGIALAQQPTGKSINFYSLEKEIALGDRLAEEVRHSVTTITDPRLDEIGERLVPKTTRFQYRFFVFEGGDNETGAKAFSGGPIFVPRHLIASSDGRLAAILAIAIGHVELHHGTRMMTKREISAIGQHAPRQPMPAHTPALVPSGFAQLQWGFDLEADAYAFKLLADAGFDTDALLDWLRTLPDGAQRIAALAR
jgi:beta-barrel assembly-enhancing protease